MRRSVEPNCPRAMTCCFFASLKMLAMAAEGPQSPPPRQRLERLLPMAGFQVSIYGRFWVSTEGKRRQSTALHATRRNQVSAVVRQAKHYCEDRDDDLQDVVADPPRLPSWERVVGDGRHLREERPAVLDQPVSNLLAFSGSPHATLRFPKSPRRGRETTAGSTEGWSNHLAFRIAGEALAA